MEVHDDDEPVDEESLAAAVEEESLATEVEEAVPRETENAREQYEWKCEQVNPGDMQAESNSR